MLFWNSQIEIITNIWNLKLTIWNNNQLFMTILSCNHNLLTSWKCFLYILVNWSLLSQVRKTKDLFMLLNNASYHSCGRAVDSHTLTIPQKQKSICVSCFDLSSRLPVLLFSFSLRYLRAKMKGQGWRSSYLTVSTIIKFCYLTICFSFPPKNILEMFII